MTFNPIAFLLRHFQCKKKLNTRPEFYDWWVDVIQDCMCQISGEYELLNPESCACEHICDEVYIELSHFADAVRMSSFCDIPIDIWDIIIQLSKEKNLECDCCAKMAHYVLISDYFRTRKRWEY